MLIKRFEDLKEEDSMKALMKALMKSLLKALMKSLMKALMKATVIPRKATVIPRKDGDVSFPRKLLN